MPSVALRAHFDGTQILLDEEYELPTNAQLVVTVLESSTPSDTREDWTRVSATSLAAAYGDDEPNYSIAEIAGTTVCVPLPGHFRLR